MMQIIPNGGPMWDQPLSDMRVAALLAVDQGPTDLPKPVTDYIMALERHYHQHLQERNDDFLRSSWGVRTKKETTA